MCLFVFLCRPKHNITTQLRPSRSTSVQPSDLDPSTQQPETEYQTMSNNDDGTFMQPMVSNNPPGEPDEYQYVNDPEINSTDEPKPPTGTVVTPSAQTYSAICESLHLDPDSSTEQPEMEYDDCINTSDNRTYLGVLPNFSPNDHEKYEHVRNSETISINEKPYMDLDPSSRQPDSEFQEVTNPENLKQPDMYLALDLKSSITDSEYQALGPRDSEPIYDTAM